MFPGRSESISSIWPLFYGVFQFGKPIRRTCRIGSVKLKLPMEFFAAALYMGGKILLNAGLVFFDQRR